MAELRERLPALRQADLVRLEDGTWLDIRTWIGDVVGAIAEASAVGERLRRATAASASTRRARRGPPGR